MSCEAIDMQIELPRVILVWKERTTLLLSIMVTTVSMVEILDGHVYCLCAVIITRKCGSLRSVRQILQLVLSFPLYRLMGMKGIQEK